jgi:small subunit ribosomal protein S20
LIKYKKSIIIENTFMPNTQSAKKALRQNERRNKRNVAQMKILKGAIKAFRKAPSQDGLTLAYKKLDKAAKTDLIKKNKASRLKSRLSKQLNVKTS